MIVKAPHDFNVSVDPTIVKVFRPGEKASFRITVETPSNANAGDYYVFFKVDSEGLLSLGDA